MCNTTCTLSTHPASTTCSDHSRTIPITRAREPLGYLPARTKTLLGIGSLSLLLIRILGRFNRRSTLFTHTFPPLALFPLSGRTQPPSIVRLLTYSLQLDSSAHSKPLPPPPTSPLLDDHTLPVNGLITRPKPIFLHLPLVPRTRSATHCSFRHPQAVFGSFSSSADESCDVPVAQTSLPRSAILSRSQILRRARPPSSDPRAIPLHHRQPQRLRSCLMMES